MSNPFRKYFTRSTHNIKSRQARRGRSTLVERLESREMLTVMDDGDAGFSTSGTWATGTGSMLNSDFRLSAADGGNDVAEWDFTVTTGQYRISATWGANANYWAVAAPFSVLDNGLAIDTVLLNQRQAPDDFTETGTAWEDIGVFNITSTSLTIQLADAQDGYVVADGIRIERLGNLPTSQEIAVIESGVNIADESSLEFEAAYWKRPVTKTFTVINQGSQNLTLSNGSLSVPAGYSIASLFGSTSLSPGQSTTFAVKLDAASVGQYHGDVSFTSNDGDESPFTFEVSGVVLPVQILDNGMTGFSVSGTWSTTGVGFEGDSHFSVLSDGAGTATWEFDVTPGRYRVSATWVSDPTFRATDAPYTILDGSTPLDTVEINQRHAPDDLIEAETGWEHLGTSYTISGNTLVVELSNNADGYVFADAIRIQRLGDAVETSVPIAVNDPWYSTPVNTDLVVTTAGVTLLDNDWDPDGDTITATIIDNPAHGSITSFNSATGEFTYDPGSSFSGLDSFTYQLSDGTATSNIATVRLSVGGVFGPRTNDEEQAQGGTLALFWDENRIDGRKAGDVLFTGGLELKQALSPGLELVYQSNTFPRPIVAVDTTLLATSSAPDSIDAQLTFGGITGDVYSYDTSSLQPGDPLRIALQADASSLDTGRYAYDLELTAWFGSTPVSITYSGYQASVNRTESEFGPGWWLAGLDRLVSSTGGMLLVHGDGSTLWYPEDGSGGYLPAEGDLRFATLVENIDNTFTLTAKDGTRREFSAAGLLTAIVDTNDNETAFTYADADSDMVNDELSQITDPYARDTTFSYTSGLLSSVEDFAGRESTLSFTNGALTSVTQPDPGVGEDPPVTTFEYIEDGTAQFLIIRIDPENLTTGFTYDFFARRLIAIDHQDQTQWSVTPVQTVGLPMSAPQPSTLFQPDDAVATVGDERNHDSFARTDRFGNVIQWVDQLSNTTLFERNAHGQLVRLTEADPDGGGGQTSPITVRGYNSLGDLVHEYLPDSAERAWTYSTDFHRVLSFDNELGDTVSFTTDSRGNRITDSDALGNIVVYSYSDRGMVTSMVQPDPDGAAYWGPATTRYAYDSFDRLTTLTNADRTTRHFEYDTADNLSSETDELGNEMVYVFDALDRLVSVTDPTTAATTWDYNGVGNVVAMTDPLGRTTDYHYNFRNWLSFDDPPDPDGAGPLIRIHTFRRHFDGVGNVSDEIAGDHENVTYTYDDANRLIEINRPVEGQTTFTPDNLGRTVEVTDPLGRVTQYVFNSRGWITQVTLPDPDGVGGQSAPVITYEYDAAGRKISETDALGRETTYEYDPRGLLVKLTQADPDGAGGATSPVTTYTYDAWRRRISETDPLGRTKSWTYNSRGETLMVQQFDALLNFELFAYDGANRLIAESDELGRTTGYTYDEVGRVLTVTLPDPDGPGGQSAPVTTYEYDLAGNLISVTDALGNETVFARDAHDRITSVTLPDPDGAGGDAAPIITYEYNDVGELSVITDPLSRTITLTHDVLGRLTSRTNDEDETYEYTYDAVGNLTLMVDPDLRETAITYDGLNRRTSVTDPESGVTTFGYDAVGNLTSIADPESNTTTFVFDNLNRLIEEINELSQSRTYEYDAVGNMVRRTDRNGRIIEYTFDELDRVEEERWYTGATLVRTMTYTHDDASQLLTASDPDANYAYTYDGLGRVVSDSNAGTPGVPEVEFTLGFDVFSRLTSLAATIDSTADFKNAYTYDNLSRLIQLTQFDVTGGNTVADKRVDFSYNALGQYTQIARFKSLAGGSSNEVATSTYSYDSLNRLSGLEHKHSTTTIADYSWDYDSRNLVTEFISPDGTNTYGYDENGQLMSASLTSESYSYDSNGNRTISGYQTGDNNQLLSDGIYDYTYDDEGNRLTRTNIMTDEVTEYEWDHRNRLVKVTEKDAMAAVTRVVAYTYDVFNRRISRKVDTTSPFNLADAASEWYVWAGEHVAFDFVDPDGSGGSPQTLARRYLVGLLTDQILAQEDAGTNDVIWHLADNLGTVRDVVDDSGAVVEHFSYDSFGNLLPGSTMVTRFLFAGRELDALTGLYYNRERWYDPATGRWISEDPAGFLAGDTNLVRYVLNSPTNFTDPSGLGVVGTSPGFDVSPKDLLDHATDLATGFGSGLSFGITDWINAGLGTDAQVDKDSWLYAGGEFAGELVLDAITDGAARGARAGGKIGKVVGKLDDCPTARLCFVAGTPVLVPNRDVLAGATGVALTADVAPDWWQRALVAGLVLVGFAGWQFGEARQRAKRKEEEDAIDELFAADLEQGESDMEPDHLLPDLGSAEFEAELETWLDPAEALRATRNSDVMVPSVCETAIQVPRRQATNRARFSCASQNPPQSRSNAAKHGWGTWWLAACLMLAGGLGVLGTRPFSSAPEIAAAAGHLASQEAIVARSIETIRVGQRVLANNPDVPDNEHTTETAVDPATWRLLRLRAEERWPDGTLDVINVETLQPPEWVNANHAQVGASVPMPLDLVEMGLPEDLRGKVVANEPCAAIADGAGHVVLTTVDHLNPAVVELTLQNEHGRTDAIRPTGPHKFYSASRLGWFSADKLIVGEKLRGTDGDLTVQAVSRVPGVHRVYNMTVEHEHVYHVSAFGVIVHNNHCREVEINPNRGHDVGGPLTDDDAIASVNAGGDVITSGGKSHAHDIAEAAGDGPPIHHGPHGPGQKSHYHPTFGGEHGKGHVLY